MEIARTGSDLADLSNLADLGAFAAVARQRSFRGAATRRGVSPSSLSEAVRRLESGLGVRLLNRTTRSVTPTEAGARLLERLVPALGEVAAALDAVDVGGDTPSGTLRLNVPSIVARLILPPITDAFLAAHPGIALEVMADDSFIDVLGAGFDAGVRYDDRLQKDMIAVPIGPRRQRYVTAAAPSYLAAQGVPKHPKDLLHHACLCHSFASGVVPPWEFERRGKTLRITPARRILSNATELRVSAAVAGLGIVYGFSEFTEAAVADGTLVPILDDWQISFAGPYLYYPSRRLMPAPLRAFVDFITGKASSAVEQPWRTRRVGAVQS